jgi:hypothetical protein
LALALITLRQLLVIAGVFELRGYIDLFTRIIDYWVILSGMVYEYLTLTRLLKEFHKDHFEKIKRPIQYFFLFELIGLIASFSFLIGFILQESFDLFTVS